MSIIVVGNTKGGVGKTIIATNIAAILAGQQRDVLLIDGDEQGSAAMFATIRAELPQNVPRFATVRLQGKAIRQELPRLVAKYDEIVIDVGGRDTDSLRAALTRADVVLVPFQPRSIDIWSADQMATLITDARTINERIAAFSIINAADPQGRDNEDAAAALRAVEGIVHLPTIIGRRKTFPNAFSNGRAVTEEPVRDPKAIVEITSVVKALYTQEADNGYQNVTRRKAG
jgi:chromosome partitioning protein